jgi:hypothetical protein
VYHEFKRRGGDVSFNLIQDYKVAAPFVSGDEYEPIAHGNGNNQHYTPPNSNPGTHTNDQHPSQHADNKQQDI